MLYKIVKEPFKIEELEEYYKPIKINAKSLIREHRRVDEKDPNAKTYFLFRSFRYIYPDHYFDDMGYCDDEDINDAYGFQWQLYIDDKVYSGDVDADYDKAYQQLLEKIPEEVLNKLAKTVDEIDQQILVCKWIDTSDNKKAVVELWNEFQGDEGEGSADFVYPNNQEGWAEMLEVKGAEEVVLGVIAGTKEGIRYKVYDPEKRWMFYDTFKGVVQPISLEDFVHSGPIRSDSLAIYLLKKYTIKEIEQKFKEK